MTLDTYADLFEDDLADVAPRMNQGGLDADVTRLWSVEGVEVWANCGRIATSGNDKGPRSA